MIRSFFIAIFAVYFPIVLGESLVFSNNQHEQFDFNDTCTAPGIMCSSCKELVQCVEINLGEFDTIHLQDCETTKGYTCMNNICTNETNPRCNNQQVEDFVCSNTGIFPDPYDCKRYHICAQKEDTVNGLTVPPINLKCRDNYGYDPVTTYCKTVLVNGICPRTPPIPICKKAGESAAIAGTSIYYICLYEKNILLPHLYMCQHGKKYINSKCT